MNLTMNRILTKLGLFAFIFFATGAIAQSIDELKAQIEAKERALGLDHPDVASSLNHLGLLYSNQGRDAEAEPLYKRSLAAGRCRTGRAFYAQET